MFTPITNYLHVPRRQEVLIHSFGMHVPFSMLLLAVLLIDMLYLSDMLNALQDH